MVTDGVDRDVSDLFDAKTPDVLSLLRAILAQVEGLRADLARREARHLGETKGYPQPAAEGTGARFGNYGRSKGRPVTGASLDDLEYYAAGCRRSLADPDKQRFHDKERVMLAAIEREIARQSGAPAPAEISAEDIGDEIPF